YHNGEYGMALRLGPAAGPVGALLAPGAGSSPSAISSSKSAVGAATTGPGGTWMGCRCGGAAAASLSCIASGGGGPAGTWGAAGWTGGGPGTEGGGGPGTATGGGGACAPATGGACGAPMTCPGIGAGASSSASPFRFFPLALGSLGCFGALGARGCLATPAVIIEAILDTSCSWQEAQRRTSPVSATHVAQMTLPQSRQRPIAV
ncbi:MAG: hypothetical protein KJ993_05000, partial [Actinobacteria bacterium]|nr:hypothetical protein [Actinomycetota bacterium]